MTVCVGDDCGWRRTVELSPAQGFSGTSRAVSGALDLRRVRELTQRLERETGYTRDHFDLVRAPRLRVAGTVARHRIEDTFDPEPPFQLDAQKLRLMPGDWGTAPDAGAQAPDPLSPWQEGMVRANEAEANTRLMLMLHIPVALALSLAEIALQGRQMTGAREGAEGMRWPEARLLALSVLALVLASAAYANASSNTVVGKRLGEARFPVTANR